MADKRTADQRAEAAAARAWAAENGLSIAPTGRLPSGVLASYRAAAAAAGPGAGGGGAEPDPDGPDWDAAAGQLGEQLGGDLLDDLEPGDQLGDGGQDEDQAAAPAIAGPEQGTGPASPAAAPPPASLEEARARLGGGGERRRPVWAARTPKPSRDKRPAPPPVKVTKGVVDDITGKLALLAAIPVATWQTIDPICGGAAAANLDNIVQTAVPLICLSPEAVRWLTQAGKFTLLLAFAQACQPVAVTAYQHHVTRTVAMLPDGRLVHGELQHDGSVLWPDGGQAAAAAAAPRPDYSAYTTKVTGHVPPVHAAAR